MRGAREAKRSGCPESDEFESGESGDGNIVDRTEFAIGEFDQFEFVKGW